MTSGEFRDLVNSKVVVPMELQEASSQVRNGYGRCPKSG